MGTDIMYKGLNTPWIGKSAIRLGITESVLGPDHRCIITYTYKRCKGTSCGGCVFGLLNITIGLEYLIEQKFITKGEALAFSLDNIGSIQMKGG